MGWIQPGEGVREVTLAWHDSALCERLCAWMPWARAVQVPVADRTACLAAVRIIRPALMLVDIDPPGEGLDLLADLQGVRTEAVIAFTSGSGGLRAAVEAMRRGAQDVLEAPSFGAGVAARLREAAGLQPAPDLTPMSSRELTLREREVLEHVVAGVSNKGIGRLLGISPRTVETHRAHVMSKIGARNTADLVRMVVSSAAGAQA